ncbi:MAG: TOMM precursor leader peptide-binding protein [Actinomycetia bacterium]|nr:TOMM precursor leader peptide-binding protein [Actinomycetes bacterium]
MAEIKLAGPGARAAREMILNPAVRVLWRDGNVVQLELGSRAVVVDGLDTTAIRQLTGQSYEGDPIPASAVAALREERFVLDPRAQPAPGVPRLASELAALQVRHGALAEDILTARRRSVVQVDGASRLAPSIAVLLAAAGVGQVAVSAQGDVRLAHTVPGGLAPADEGARFTRASFDAIRRAAPDCDPGPLPPGAAPDLTILTTPGPIDTDVRLGLHTRGGAHLVVQADGDRAVVGPLVVPGSTSCLHCADLHRQDRDPAWPLLAAQLATPLRSAAPSDAILCCFAAALAAWQALAYLGGDCVDTVEGTVELDLPGGRIRRRTLPAHPACGCGAVDRVADAASA